MRHELIPLQSSDPLHLVDMGLDFYLINFHLHENYDKGLHGGPWFVKQ